MSKCLNKNTVFYKNLVELNYTKEQILQINLQIESEKFKNWYEEGEKDAFGQPKVIENVYLENNKGEQIRLKDLLNDEFFEKRQYFSKDLTYIDKINQFLDAEKEAINKRISNFRNTKYAENLKLLLDEIEKIDKNDYTKSLAKHYEYILNNVGFLELKLHTYDKSVNDKTPEFKENYKNFLSESLNFLSSFSKITNLETPKNEGEVRTLIVKLKTLENRVSELDNKIRDRVEEEIRNTLTPLIKNPKVREGVIDFLAAQVDEGKTSMLLDALGDSHNIFLSAIDKFYKLNMADKDDEVKTKNKEWDSIVKDMDFNSFMNRVLEVDKNGNKTGRFIQEYDEDFYNEIYDYNEKLGLLRKAGKKNSKEYNDLLGEYFNWKRENQEQKFKKEYYDSLNLLTPEAREAKVDIDNAKNLILSKGKDKLNTDDYEMLRELDEKMRWMKSSVNPDGTPKENKELEIARSLYKYSKELSKFYETIGINKKGFDKARKAAEEKGFEELERFDFNNTSEQFHEVFWGKFNALIAELPKAKSVEELNAEIGQLLIGFKNERGEVEVDKVPKDILDKVEDLEKRKSSIKSEMNKSVNINKRREIARRFKDLIKFVPTTYYLNLLASKNKQLEDKEITQEEYNRWFKDNHYTDPFTEETEPLKMFTVMKPRNPELIEKLPNKLWSISDIKKDYLNPNFDIDNNGHGIPKPKWRNKTYDSLDSKDKENLTKVNDFLGYLVAHSKDNLIKRGYLPVFAKDKRTIIDIAKGKKLPDEEGQQKIISESDEIVKFIPFKYVKKLVKQDLPEFPENATEEEIGKIKEERKRIREENVKFHGEAIDYNLAENMKVFVNAALTNKYKTNMELDINLFREQFKRQKIKVTGAKGEQFFDKIKSKVRGSKVDYEVSALGSNIQKHFESWIDAIFYEDFELDEGRLAEVANKIQDFTSLRALGLNVLSGVNNKLIGNLQGRIESFGGRYYNYRDYRKSRYLYTKGMMSFIADRNTKKSSNFLSGFLKEFDILVSQDELSNKPDGRIKTLLHKAKMIKDSAYFFQHVGEHQIQNSTLVAMALSHRIIDGEIMTFQEFYEKKKFKVDWKIDLDAAYKAMEQNEELKKTLQAEFDSHTNIIDAYEFKDGYVQLKEGVDISKRAIQEFKMRVIGINQRFHGIYNTEDAAMLQRHALGRLAMQFRKFMRPNWNRRFGKRFGKTDYNERIGDYEEGMYISFAKYVASPFTDTYQKYKDEQMNLAYKAYKVVLEGFKDSLIHTKVRWHSMSEMEKSNVRKTFGELLFLVSVIGLGFLLKSLKDGGDDDDKFKKKFLTWTLYQSDRLFGELSTFTPFGVVRETNRLFKSPSPVFNTLEDIIKLGSQMMLYPFRDEEERQFKSGIYHGQDKVKVYAEDFVPVYNQFKRLLYLEENNQKYGMFK